MSRRRTLLLASVCVEAVALVSVAAYGYLSLVAVVILYWIDLLFVALRAMTQQLISRPSTNRRTPFLQLPFRLLVHKRGTVSISDSLPPVYLRNVPGILGIVFIVVISASSVGYVFAVTVPAAFWTSPTTPLVLAAGTVAAATKSWLVLGEHVASGVHESEPAYAVAPGKRMLLLIVYVLPLGIVSDWAIALPALQGMETTRTGMMVFALVLIALRLVYAAHASRSRFDDEGAEGKLGGETTDSDDGIVSGLQSMFSAEQDVFVPSSPSAPDGTPFETMTPNRRSVLAAGVVNAVTTGGVVDGQFAPWRQLSTRVGMVMILPVAGLALLDGAVVVSAALIGILLCLIAVLSAVSTVHMRLALGSVEYRFYDSQVVAYDTYLNEPQWSVRYDSVRDVSVERGLFGSPLWLDAGTVFFDRVGTPDGPEFENTDPRSSIAFVPDPERVGKILQPRDGR